MGPEQAADVLTQVRVAGMQRRGEPPTPEETERIRTEVTAYFAQTYHSYYLTSDLRDDGLIDPTDTRNTLGMSLSAVLNAPIVRAPGGVLRI
jgi:3-methylcrotonyl-CoA carboxylase beta subunit